MKPVSLLLLPFAGVLGSPLAARGTDVVVYTTVVVPVYTTYCPEPTTFRHKNHTYTVTKPTTFTICETKTRPITKHPHPPHSSVYHNTTTPCTTPTKPPHTSTTSCTTTSEKETTSTSKVVPTTSAPTTVPTAGAALNRYSGAGGALALGIGMAAFLL